MKKIINKICSIWNIITIQIMMFKVLKNINDIDIADNFFRKNTTKYSLSKRVVALIDDEIKRGKTFETQQSLASAFFFKALKHGNIDLAKIYVEHCIKIWILLYIRIKGA